MGWFDAGTDNKITAPDLFGSVQLPLPASCFGVSESLYGSKQRDFLLAHLQDEKSHSQPWPAAIKACFTTGHTTGAMNSKVILGSPMLDTALGQVYAVTEVLQELRAGAPGVIAKGTDKKQAETSGQFDSCLPPEMPTNWVQCEKCHKWRRVAWHVDSDSLPDDWFCEMNEWDPQNANCSVPQDGFDPDRESTLEYKTSTDLINDEVNFKIGSFWDIYCLKNCIYYVACVKKVKPGKKSDDKVESRNKNDK